MTKIKTLLAAAAAIASVTGTAEMVQSSSTPQQFAQHQQRKQVSNKMFNDLHAPVQSKSDLFGYGNRNPFKYYRTPKTNQRQYRKWMRQVPQMRKSKKCKLKNR